MIGERIQRARKAQGVSLRALGEALGLSHAAIKKYEDNEVVPSSDILLKLAQALHVKTEYFFRPEHFTLNNIQYRAHANMPKQHREEITARILNQIERRVELENLFPSSPIQSLILNLKKINTYDEIELAANQIRKQWNLGLEPLANLIDIFEEHGIKIFEIDNCQYPKFEGLSAYINDMPVIVIGNGWSGEHQRFTLAHELGHLVFNGLLNSVLEEEKVCDHFAGAFLLPKEALITALGEHRNSIEPRELNILKETFGISMANILNRIENVGIISKNLFLQLRSDFNSKGWLKKEPGIEYPREKTHIFEQMIFHALAEEYIGESKAAELMNISIESLRSLRAMESRDVTSYQ